MDHSAYSNLSRAQLSFDYLHTNSTTHEFLFGALAELLDNARDANSTKMNIFTISDNSLRGGFILCFLDDGMGMDPVETAGIVTFGRSTKRSDDMYQIGMYGNGLKSGSMRIGNDLMVFTKKNGIKSCLFLSRTFHEEENIDEVIVPIPSFEKDSRKPHLKDANRQKHNLEMDIILKYSPFKTADHFFEQFDRIEQDNGTLVMVYNLKLLDSGDPELDIISDRTDILLANPTSSDFDTDEGLYDVLMPEKKSFRAYTSVLYVDPRMRIYIQNTKVRTKKLACSLYKSKMYKYSSNRFKTRAENEAKRAIDEALTAEDKAREAESKAKNLEKKGSMSKADRANLRKAQNHAAECRGNAVIKRNICERKAKSLKEPKTLNLIFGINIENRNHCGVFVYNCSRLIKMYEKVGPQNEGGVCCSGVVGIVDVPYLVLEPTHNKQDFADAKEYRHLLRAMGEHMAQYWKDVGIAQQGITKFWENFGYTSSEWKDPPVDDIKYKRKRAMQLSVTLQCDMCLKWRMIPFNSSNIGKEFPDHWVCTMNPDQQHNKCSSLEQRPNIPEGVLKKEIKSQEQKKRDLEEEILKKKEMLDKMMKLQSVESSKDISKVIKKDEKPGPLSKKSRIRSPSPSPEPPSKPSRSSSKSAPPKRSRRSPSPSPPPPPPRSTARSSSKSAPAPKSTPPVKNKPKKKSPSPPPKRAPPSRSKKPPVEEEEEEEVEEEEDTPKASRRGRSQNNVSIQNDVKRKQQLKEKEIEFPEIPVKKQRISHFNSEKEKETDLKKTKEPVKKDNDRSSRSDQVSSNSNASSKREAVISTEKPTRSLRFNLDTEKNTEIEEKTTRTSRSRGKPENVTDTTIQEITEENEALSKETDDAEKVKEEDLIGSKADVKVNNKWVAATIIEVKDGKYKLKLDHLKEKHDKWYDYQDIKILEKKVEKKSTTISNGVDGDAVEEPTSSTTSTQIADDIANGYRQCLRYFLPPQWIMEKHEITTMTSQELSDFPLDDFFDHYERGLRRLVSNFQTEAASRKEEADSYKEKLVSLRKLIAKLLKSTNDEFDIDPEESGDQVDELLAACVRQATSPPS